MCRSATPRFTAASLPRTPPPAGRLFRSGCPAKASHEEVLLLRRELHVQQMIDFRWGGWGASGGGLPGSSEAAMDNMLLLTP